MWVYRSLYSFNYSIKRKLSQATTLLTISKKKYCIFYYMDIFPNLINYDKNASIHTKAFYPLDLITLT